MYTHFFFFLDPWLHLLTSFNLIPFIQGFLFYQFLKHNNCDSLASNNCFIPPELSFSVVTPLTSTTA